MPIDITNVVLPPIPAPKAALLSIQLALQSMAPERIQRHVTIDIGVAGRTVIGNLRDLARIVDELEAIFGAPARERIDWLPTLAMAAVQAQTDYAAARDGVDLTEKGREVAAFQSRLYIAALALANDGLLNADAVDSRKGGLGYKAQYEAVLGLIDLFRNAWSEITGKTAITLDVLDAAEEAVRQMVVDLGVRDQEASITAAADVRARVFTLLDREWEEVRRMVGYLRHHEGDRDEFAPSLWTAVRRNGGKKEDGVGEPASPSPSPSPVTGDPVDPDKDPDPSDPFV